MTLGYHEKDDLLPGNVKIVDMRKLLSKTNGIHRRYIKDSTGYSGFSYFVGIVGFGPPEDRGWIIRHVRDVVESQRVSETYILSCYSRIFIIIS